MKKFIFYAASAVVMVSSCNQQSSNTADEIADTKMVYKNENKPDAPPNAPDNEKVSSNKTYSANIADTTSVEMQGANADSVVIQGSAPQIDWNKKIIKTANITLELSDFAGFNSGIHSRLKAYGAYVSAEQQNETDERISNDITIKVPVDKFDDLISSIPGNGIKVLEKNITTADVTAEVVDTKARIEAKKEVRAKYLELLKQAKNMDEILQVQDEINNIQEDIESASGRMSYLIHDAAYSTINLQYYQFINGITAKDVEPNFLTSVSNAFKDGGSIITNAIILCIQFWPFIITAILLLIFYKRTKHKKSILAKTAE